MKTNDGGVNDMLHQVWMEGFCVMEGASGASFVGIVEAETFSEAVVEAVRLKVEQGMLDGRQFNKDRLTYWGCRFFESEYCARKSFG